ncbi:MAG: alpha/beta hydrolase [Alphaproteobacteria bacterium]
MRFFAFAVAGYAGLVGALFLGQRRLMYPAGETPPGPVAAGVPEMRAVRVATADGLDLLAWYAAARDERPTLIYFHGNAGHLGHRAAKVRPFVEAGYGVLLLAWRGYSGNPGSPSEDGLYHDARAAFAFLEADGVPPERVVLYGESLGSGVAVQMATEKPVAALVLEAPYTSMVEVAQRHYWYFPIRHILLDRYDSLAKIGDLRLPLLVIHGELDRVVPSDLGRTLFEAAHEPKELRLFADGGHSDLYDHGAGGAVLDFLRRTFP